MPGWTAMRMHRITSRRMLFESNVVDGMEAVSLVLDNFILWSVEKKKKKKLFWIGYFVGDCSCGQILKRHRVSLPISINFI